MLVFYTLYSTNLLLLALRNKGNTGSIMFPLQVDDADGLCHYRLMVKHVGIEQNCVYESASFKVVHKPQDKFNGSTEPYFEQNPVYTYWAKSMDDLYNTTVLKWRSFISHCILAWTVPTY